jgi:hypothetical protein
MTFESVESVIVYYSAAGLLVGLFTYTFVVLGGMALRMFKLDKWFDLSK